MADENPLPVSSSVPPEFPPEQIELFRDTLNLLNERKIPYAVSGAFALQHHTGIWRNTKDLDLFMTSDDASRALVHLREGGFECEILDPIWLAKAHRDNYFVDLITGMSNGALSVDRCWIERAHPAIVLGVHTRVLGAEELLASKLFVWARERFDGADIAHILYATPARLDWQRIFTLVGDHRGLLFAALALFHYIYPDSSNNIPSGVWNTLLEDFVESLGRRGSQPKFRGTLLDEKMFAIDVKEWGLPNPVDGFRTRKTSVIREAGKNKDKAA
jgi:hypothetical protein